MCMLTERLEWARPERFIAEHPHSFSDAPWVPPSPSKAARLQSQQAWHPNGSAQARRPGPAAGPTCVQVAPDPASRRPPVWLGSLAEDAHSVNLVRSDGSLWTEEPSADAKAECLREVLLHGTHRVEVDYFSQHGEDGILLAAFRCIGHRDKCALLL